jgi:hypothetical protein
VCCDPAAELPVMSSSERDWPRYNRALVGQGRLELFVSAEVLAGWTYAGPQRRGGKRLYSGRCIQTCLMLRELLGLGLRQTQGLVQSIMALAGLTLPVPDYTTLQRRTAALAVDLGACRGGSAEAVVLAVDATGLTVTRRGEWHARQHGRPDGRAAGASCTWPSTPRASRSSPRSTPAPTAPTAS